MKNGVYAHGYLWKVISPKGKVYTEVLKTLTIEDPLYVEGKSIEMAFKMMLQERMAACAEEYRNKLK